MRRIGPFLLAGGAGFAVDAGVLILLTRIGGLDPFVARLVSVSAAILTTWLINRLLTFGPSGRPVAVEGARYGGVAVAVALINYVVYAGVLLVAPKVPPLAALVVASGAAMVLSYAGYSRLVFSRPRPSQSR
jgi:putative flippase GtrA